MGDDTRSRTSDERSGGAPADPGGSGASGPAGDDPAPDRDPDPSEEGASANGDRRSTRPDDRYVVVPMRLYKTVTVFSTLLAVVAILAGFVLLDRGTQRATAGAEDVSLPVVALGLAFIVGGSAVYAFSTRFRAEGMGKPKDDTGEQSNNG